MSLTDDRVRRYYDAFDEWRRLDAPAGRFEFLRTMYFLHHYLPEESRILDLGGGPGRYSIALARKGHRVTLADLSPVQLKMAERKIEAAGVGDYIESVDTVDATDLERYNDGSFDAVVALGPFYHLTSPDQREKAAREVLRVTRRGGYVFVSFMPPIVGVTGLIDRAAVDPEQVDPDAYVRVLHENTFANRTKRGFQDAWYGSADEIARLFKSAGCTRLDVTSIRGIGNGREEAILQLRTTEPEQFNGIMRALHESARNPAVIATSGHAIYVGQKGQDA